MSSSVSGIAKTRSIVLSQDRECRREATCSPPQADHVVPVAIFDRSQHADSLKTSSSTARNVESHFVESAARCTSLLKICTYAVTRRPSHCFSRSEKVFLELLERAVASPESRGLTFNGGFIASDGRILPASQEPAVIHENSIELDYAFEYESVRQILIMTTLH